MLPAWDAIMGGLAATGLLAADRHRTRTGEGQLVRVALSDVAFAMVGHLGRVAEAQLGSRDTPKDGNYLYGAFGHDFATSDGRRVMVVALTTRQWNALLEVTGLARAVGAIEQAMGIDLQSVSDRFQARDLLAAVLRPWFEARTLSEIRAAFAGTGVSWGAYQTFSQLVHEDPRCSTDNEMWEMVEHPGVGQLPDARHAAGLLSRPAGRRPARTATRRAHRSRPRGAARHDHRRNRPPRARRTSSAARAGQQLHSRSLRRHAVRVVTRATLQRPMPRTLRGDLLNMPTIGASFTVRGARAPSG